MMAHFPFMRVYVESWRSDTHHLSLAQEGAYWRLLHTMWVSPGCRVPDDNGWLQYHLHVTKDELRELVRPIINEFCRVEGKYIVQKRLLKEFEHALQTNKRMSALGKRRKNKEGEPSSAC